MVKNLRRCTASIWLAFAVGTAVMLTLAGCSSGSSSETAVESIESPTEPPQEPEQDSSSSQRLTEAPAETEFFRLTIDGEPHVGSGLVFDNGGELHVRGLFGAEMDHLQLDLTSSGFSEQSPTIVGVALSRVIGLDATESRYVLVDDASNRFSIHERGPALTVWGDFSFQAQDVSSGEQVTVSGVFDAPIGSSGDWDCDWSGEPPACGFIS